VQKLADTNTERQKQTESMFVATKQQADTQTEQAVLCVQGENWPIGLIGLVAGKLVTQYHKPAFVLTKHNGTFFGSGRSLPGVNLIKTLQTIDTLFDKYGGHAMACGFSLLPTVVPAQFVEKFTAAAATSLDQLDPIKEVTIAAELTLAQVNWQLAEQLTWLEPFGEQHPEPLFRLAAVQLKDFQTVGATQKHLRLVLTDTTGRTLKAIAFGLGERAADLHLGDTIQVIGTVTVNQWNGNRELQFQVKDIV
jgi:single-stranded-DNA-specific exonuclease